MLVTSSKEDMPYLLRKDEAKSHNMGLEMNINKMEILNTANYDHFELT